MMLPIIVFSRVLGCSHPNSESSFSLFILLMFLVLQPTISWRYSFGSHRRIRSNASASNAWRLDGSNEGYLRIIWSLYTTKVSDLILRMNFNGTDWWFWSNWEESDWNLHYTSHYSASDSYPTITAAWENYSLISMSSVALHYCITLKEQCAQWVAMNALWLISSNDCSRGWATRIL
jgi:hypothetical protein